MAVCITTALVVVSITLTAQRMWFPTRSMQMDTLRGYERSFVSTGDPVFIRKLAYKVTNGSDFEQYQAACILGEIGPPTVIALPELLHGVRSGSRSVKVACVDAILRIGPDAKEASLSLMQTVTECPYGEVVYAAIKALGEVADPADPAALVFLDNLKGATADHRIAASWAAERIRDRRDHEGHR